ncbi:MULTISPECIES: hypothetical protein [Pedobacter]|jgi:hypothetical protein|uniref:hypothetical protein n=1 Tax=Pedobacter TaxID=84567 RepID=UPI00146B46A7|nr:MULTISPECIES: hypothetical protein [Pedobacter]
MFKQLNDLNGNEIYMLLSLFIFFTFFVGATIALIKMKKSHVNYMENIPLESDND